MAWSVLSTFLDSHSNQIVFIGGKFNTVLNPNEEKGRNCKCTKTIDDLKSWINRNHLMDIEIEEGIFTWINKRQGQDNVVQK